MRTSEWFPWQIRIAVGRRINPDDALPKFNAIGAAKPPPFTQCGVKVRRDDIMPRDDLIMPIPAVAAEVRHPRGGSFRWDRHGSADDIDQQQT
jgi:hypothetical protein